MIFVGESITVGHGLAWDETYPALVGKALDLQVVNLGVHGYGADQSFCGWSTSSRVRAPVAVVSIFIPAVIERLARYDHPHLVFDGVEPRVVPTDGAWDQMRLLPPLGQSILEYHDDATFALAAHIFRETSRRARERGAVALFVAPGIGYAPPRGDRYLLDAFFADQGLAYVDGDMGYEPQPGDGRPNAHATRVLADYVIAALRSKENRPPVASALTRARRGPNHAPALLCARRPLELRCPRKCRRRSCPPSSAKLHSRRAHRGAFGRSRSSRRSSSSRSSSRTS